MKHQCDNCCHITEKPNEIKDLSDRLDEGGPSPSGECPECGALVYPLTLFESAKEQAFEMIRQASAKAADAAITEIRKHSDRIVENLSEAAKSYIKKLTIK